MSRADHAYMRVDPALRDDRPARQSEMRRRSGRQSLDRRSDRENRTRQLARKIGNAELSVEILREAAGDEYLSFHLQVAFMREPTHRPVSLKLT